MKIHPLKDRLLRLPPHRRREVLAGMSIEDRIALSYDYRFNARPTQIWTPDDNITYSIFSAGRGWGKTKTGSWIVNDVAKDGELCGARKKKDKHDIYHGIGGMIGIAGRTANDVNQTMVNGDSGIIKSAPPWFRPEWIKSEKLLRWPNGVEARLMSGDVPDSFRGPNFGLLWADELPHWRKAALSWRNAVLALRLGKMARAIVTTTPLATDVMLELMFKCDEHGIPLPDPDTYHGYKIKDGVSIVSGSSHENFDNLSINYRDAISRIGRTSAAAEEIEGRIVLTPKGARWKHDWFNHMPHSDLPSLRRIICVVDPNVSAEGDAAECGIMVLGIGDDDRIYFLEDASGAMGVTEWARRAVEVSRRWDVDALYLEENNGGELNRRNVEFELERLSKEDGYFNLNIEMMRATRSKEKRADSVCGFWEMGLVCHVGDYRHWRVAEHQLTHVDFSVEGLKKKPLMDRLDAMVWGVILLKLGDDSAHRLKGLGNYSVIEQVRL